MFKKIAALATAAVLCAGLMAGCGASSTTADTSYSAENPLVLTLAASRSRSSPTASSAAKTRTWSSCRQALSP